MQMNRRSALIAMGGLTVAGCQTVRQEDAKTKPAPEAAVIKSEFSRIIRAPREKVYAIVADVEQHPRLLANIKARQILKGPLIEQWTKPNEVITFSVAMEPVDRPAFAKFIFNRPTEIVEHMVTNPFAEDLEPLDKKKGVIKYQFVDVPEGTKFTAVSEFQPTTGRFYRRAWIDGIWMDFLNRLERLAMTS
jgi:uncharacterized protein YndB with AHSA1/START domain